VALHLERGRTLLAAASLDPSLRPRVLESFSHFATPERVEWLADRLAEGNFARIEAGIAPAALYQLAEDPALASLSRDVPSVEIAAMAAENRADLSPAAIAAAFGTPKPILLHSYRPQLLNLRIFPALMGYSSRILAETWESNSLFYAALAAETGVPVNQLDAYVPAWNRAAIENIFATHLEDWPALIRSLDALRDSIRQRNSQAAASARNALVASSN